jgi:hypothetical protein
MTAASRKAQLRARLFGLRVVSGIPQCRHRLSEATTLFSCPQTEQQLKPSEAAVGYRCAGDPFM